jgi:hypothetical protein
VCVCVCVCVCARSRINIIYYTRRCQRSCTSSFSRQIADSTTTTTTTATTITTAAAATTTTTTTTTSSTTTHTHHYHNHHQQPRTSRRQLICSYFFNQAYTGLEIWYYYRQPFPWLYVWLMPLAISVCFDVLTVYCASAMAAIATYDVLHIFYNQFTVWLVHGTLYINELMVKKLSLLGAIGLILAHRYQNEAKGR